MAAMRQWDESSWGLEEEIGVKEVSPGSLLLYWQNLNQARQQQSDCKPEAELELRHTDFFFFHSAAQMNLCIFVSLSNRDTLKRNINNVFMLQINCWHENSWEHSCNYLQTIHLFCLCIQCSDRFWMHLFYIRHFFQPLVMY